MENDDGHAMLGVPGIAKEIMLDDILQARDSIAVGDADPVAIGEESGDEGGSSAGNGPPCSKVLASVPKPIGNNQKRKRDDSNKSDADVVKRAIAEILERAGAIVETKVVNNSTFNESGNNGTATNPNRRSIQRFPAISLSDNQQ